MSAVNENNAITNLIENSGLEIETVNSLKQGFVDLFDRANVWRMKALSIVVTDESQTKEMEEAKKVRLALKDIRIKSDKVRKALKADSIKYGKAVQAIYNLIEESTKPLESHLEKQEKFAEFKEKERREARRKLRLDTIANNEYGQYISIAMDFAGMDDADWLNIVNGAKLQLKAKKDAEIKAEKDRLEKERVEAEEKEKFRLANIELEKKAEILRQEKAEAEKKAAEERQKAEELLRVERAEKEKVQKALRDKQEAEAVAHREAQAKEQTLIAEKAEAERKAKEAPDKEKLMVFVDVLKSINYPDTNTAEAKRIIKNAKEEMILLVDKIEIFARS